MQLSAPRSSRAPCASPASAASLCAARAAPCTPRPCQVAAVLEQGLRAIWRGDNNARYGRRGRRGGCTTQVGQLSSSFAASRRNLNRRRTHAGDTRTPCARLRCSLSAAQRSPLQNARLCRRQARRRLRCQDAHRRVGPRRRARGREARDEPLLRDRDGGGGAPQGEEARRGHYGGDDWRQGGGRDAAHGARDGRRRGRAH